MNIVGFKAKFQHYLPNFFSVTPSLTLKAKLSDVPIIMSGPFFRTAPNLWACVPTSAPNLWHLCASEEKHVPSWRHFIVKC